MNLEDRRQRTERVLTQFRDKPFSWRGRANCIHLARAQAAEFKHKVPPVPQFSTEIGAVRALKRKGVGHLRDLLDKYLQPIPPACALIGDLVMLPGSDPFGALTINAGGGFLLGWHERDPSRMVSISGAEADAIAAWRVGA